MFTAPPSLVNHHSVAPTKNRSSWLNLEYDNEILTCDYIQYFYLFTIFYRDTFYTVFPPKIAYMLSLESVPNFENLA